MSPATRPVITFDPAMRFGRPHIRGFSVEAITEMVRAGEDVDTVAGHYDITCAEVLLACWYQGRNGTRRYRAAWGDWAFEAHRVMAGSDDWGAIPDPPQPGRWPQR